MTTDWTAFDRLLASRRRTIVESFADFLRLNSVSQEQALVRATGEWLAAAMRARGLDGRVLETGGNPAVFGERRVPGATRTVLIYCHYDTKPIPLKGWLQPNPIEPVFRRGLAEDGAPEVALAGLGDDELGGLFLHARGASDDKGPIWCHLNAIELMDAAGLAPGVNVKLIFDGERRSAPVLRPVHRGAPRPARRRRRHRDRRAKHASGRPTIAGGARGVMKIELVIEGARRDLHSGNFAVPNPAWKLNGLLSSMATPDGTPLIEGFEEDVVGPTPVERRMMAELPLDLPGLAKELGVDLPADYLDRIMFHPTLTIRGLSSGFVGAEANTSSPPATWPRHPDGEEPAVGQGYARVIDHIRPRASPSSIHDAPLPTTCAGARSASSTRALRPGQDVARHAHQPRDHRATSAPWRRAVVLMPTLGGSVPIWAFPISWRCPPSSLPMPMRTTDSNSPNEQLRLDHLFQGVRTTAHSWTDLASRIAEKAHLRRYGALGRTHHDWRAEARRANPGILPSG